jgi:hypothetical protein
MKAPSLAALAALALAPSLLAQEIPNGSEWTGGGSNETVTVNVTDPFWSGQTTVTFKVTDPSGASGIGNGSEGPTSTPLTPTVDNGDVVTTPDGSQFRPFRGKTQRKGADGQWRNMRLKKKPKPKGKTTGSTWMLPGNNVVGIPFPL